MLDSLPAMNGIEKKRRRLTLTQQILIGLGVGVAAGALVNHYEAEWAVNFRPFSLLFLRLIKMIIAPLIFATLVAGIAGAGHLRQVGRIGVRAIIYFEVVTTLALIIGLVAVNVTRPGDGITLPPEGDEITAEPQTWDEILLHTVPESVIKAMAEGEVLQIVVFSIFFAIALSLIGEKGKPLVHLCEVVSETMFKFTNIVMHYAPLGVGAAMAHRRTRRDRRPVQPRDARRHAVHGADRLYPRRPAARGVALQGAHPEVHQGGA
jgi:proton glutamate symport protein